MHLCCVFTTIVVGVDKKSWNILENVEKLERADSLTKERAVNRYDQP